MIIWMVQTEIFPGWGCVWCCRWMCGRYSLKEVHKSLLELGVLSIETINGNDDGDNDDGSPTVWSCHFWLWGKVNFVGADLLGFVLKIGRQKEVDKWIYECSLIVDTMRWKCFVLYHFQLLTILVKNWQINIKRIKNINQFGLLLKQLVSNASLHTIAIRFKRVGQTTNLTFEDGRQNNHNECSGRIPKTNRSQNSPEVFLEANIVFVMW